MRFFLLDTGYCTASEHIVISGGARRRINCHSLVALLHHPEYGYFLWDTGYAPRMIDATRRLPFRLYRYATPLHLYDDLAVVNQLDRYNLRAEDIKHVILSHFHADHVAGLLDFPDATIVAHHSAYADFTARRGLNAVRRAYIPALVPSDFHSRARLLPHFTGPPLEGLGATYDLWGDESVRLVELPGHARGQIGMLVRSDEGMVFFVADACWLRRSVTEQRPPSPLTRLFVDDYRALRQTLEGLGRFAAAHPHVRIIPTHCPDTFAEAFGYPA